MTRIHLMVISIALVGLLALAACSSGDGYYHYGRMDTTMRR